MDSTPKITPRKRAVLLVEKKIDTGEGVNSVTNDMVVSNGKDLIHTIRGESVLERSNDLSDVKKNVATSDTISPRRRKTKHERPKWHIMLSVLTKNCLLLASLLWVGQLIWQWADTIQDPSNNAFVALESKDRVSEVEASLKSMVKMFQVQLEVLDMKIESEVGDVKSKVMKQVEVKGGLLDKELKSLDGKVDSLEKSLKELKDTGFISKEEFEKFWDELMSSGKLDERNQDVDLDEIRTYARRIMENEIDKHANDGIGRVDYALAAGGAMVTEHSQPYRWSYARRLRHKVDANAHKMLEPSFGEPGQCFALDGSSGYVQIRLRTSIIPEAVTLEHVSKSVAYDRSSAPKDGIILGWLGDSAIDGPNTPSLYIIARISYDLEKSNVQTFNVEPGIVTPINNIRFEIDSNHGSSAFTCIYRLSVHGYEPSLPK